MLEKCLELLELIKTRREKYLKINVALYKLQGDFPTTVQFIDEEVEEALVAILDDILGDEIAGYYLYEASGMQDGGKITVDDREYIIKNIEDVERYILGEAMEKASQPNCS